MHEKFSTLLFPAIFVTIGVSSLVEHNLMRQDDVVCDSTPTIGQIGNSFLQARHSVTNDADIAARAFQVVPVVENRCATASKPRSDDGYPDIYRGWYDVQGCGHCFDYCRWVGYVAPPHPDPIHQREVGDVAGKYSMWSCQLAGTQNAYTPAGHFASWKFAKCESEGAPSPEASSLATSPVASRAPSLVQAEHVFDVDVDIGVGASPSSPVPQPKKYFPMQYIPSKPGESWTPSLVQADNSASALQPVGAGDSNCLTAAEPRVDEGYNDLYRGWYDVQGCGRCFDYCRWVGYVGPPHPDPIQQRIKGPLSGKHSKWSCRLAGTKDTYTPAEHFTSWRFAKCESEGAPSPPPLPELTPYVPGEPGSPWTQDEMLIVRAKLHRMFNEGGSLVWELGLDTSIPEWWDSAPNAAKVLRLGFHDCLKYTDGTGGCDGCLEYNGVGHRYKRENLEKGLFPAAGREDGHNNGLNYTAHVLDAIYTKRTFPKLTPALPISLQQSGKSRADLWAFAVLVAVEFSIDMNNMVCDDPEVLHGYNQCHPRANMPDCKVRIPRPFTFRTGRRDCKSTGSPWTSSSTPSFMTTKKEVHPSPAFNGTGTIEFFKDNFNFDGRETVTIMGAHTLGRAHVTQSLIRYTWKTRSGNLFNNGYYRNLAKKEDWYYDSRYKSSPCLSSGVGNSSGQRPIARWMPHVRGDTIVGGPVQWLQEKLTCPACKFLQQNPDTNREVYESCCKDIAPDQFCKPGCEKWKFVSGLDEIALNAEMGLYRAFEVDPNGIPFGCSGFEKFNMKHWGGFERSGKLRNLKYTWTTIDNKKAEPLCRPNTHEEPPGTTPLYKIVEEYANDQSQFLLHFFPTLEKMLTNGYVGADLNEAPASGMANFKCPFQFKQDEARNYKCVVA